MTEDRLLKVPDVMRLLNVSRSWVYRAAERGWIPSCRIGDPEEGPLRFPESELREQLARARRGPAPDDDA